MIELDQLIESIKKKRVKITDHADEEAHNDGLSFDEIYSSVLVGEIIEQYPEDEPIHSVWAYNIETEAAVLITVYRPEPAKWIEWRIRRKP